MRRGVQSACPFKGSRKDACSTWALDTLACLLVFTVYLTALYSGDTDPHAQQSAHTTHLVWMAVCRGQ